MLVVAPRARTVGGQDYIRTQSSLGGLDVRAVLAAAVEQRRAAEPAAGQPARMVPLAGEGAPEVAEFAPAELGAELSMSSASAMSLVGAALELRHRLPRLWARGDGRPAAGLEGDHIVAFVAPDDGGPPGQTAPHLLGSPCRRHHRYKTHGGWTYSMPEPGLHLWRSPLGRRYLADWTGTTNLDLPAWPRPATVRRSSGARHPSV